MFKYVCHDSFINSIEKCLEQLISEEHRIVTKMELIKNRESVGELDLLLVTEGRCYFLFEIKSANTQESYDKAWKQLYRDAQYIKEEWGIPCKNIVLYYVAPFIIEKRLMKNEYLKLKKKQIYTSDKPTRDILKNHKF